MTPARKPVDLVTFTHGRTTYRVQPANAQRLRDTLFKLERAKPARPKVPKADDTGFPQFKPGMATGEYVKQFQQINGQGSDFPRLKFLHADRAAPMLDPLAPEVLEEPDADYVAPTVVAKVKRAPASKVMVETLRMIASQATGPDWSAEQALAWVRDLARSTLEATA